MEKNAQLMNIDPRFGVEKNEGGYPTYVSSRFMSPSKIEGLDDVDSIYESVKPLDSFFQRKTYDEIKKLMDLHFFGKEESESTSSVIEEVEEDEEQNITKSSSDVEDNNLSDEDQRMQDILKDL